MSTHYFCHILFNRIKSFGPVPLRWRDYSRAQIRGSGASRAIVEAAFHMYQLNASFQYHKHLRLNMSRCDSIAVALKTASPSVISNWNMSQIVNYIVTICVCMHLLVCMFIEVFVLINVLVWRVDWYLLILLVERSRSQRMERDHSWHV